MSAVGVLLYVSVEWEELGEFLIWLVNVMEFPFQIRKQYCTARSNTVSVMMLGTSRTKVLPDAIIIQVL